MEKSVVAALLLDPSRIASVEEIVALPDFRDIRLGLIFSTMCQMAADGCPVDVPLLADRLEQDGRLQRAGGYQAVAELVDFECTTATLVPHALRVRRAALERERCELYAEGLAGRDVRPELAELERKLDGLQSVGHGRLDLSIVGFTGGRLRSLRERLEPISPLPGLLDPEPHLHVAPGKPKSGKSAFMCWIARAWALGIEPWGGAPKLPGSRVLFLSREQTVTRIDSIYRRLSTMAKGNGSDPWAWTDRITIVARDAELGSEGRRLLTLDEEGRAALRAGLLQAKEAGDPYGLVVLDSLSRLKPAAVMENDTDTMAAWLDALEEIASEVGVYILLIHHQGHTGDPGRGEARSAGRGSSAIAACAQAVWLLERVPQKPQHRLLKVDGNAILPAEYTFEVAGERSELGEILYFKPIDPLDSYAINDLIEVGETLSQSQLAWRVAGKEPEGKDDRPPGRAQEIARKLTRRWENEPGIEVVRSSNRVSVTRSGEPT
jgi:hypothetical protein